MNKKLYEKLNKYLADTGVMYIKLHNLHWNIYGMQFKGVHEYLEELYDAFTENMDAIAELIRMHNEYPAASLAAYLELSSIKELPSEKIEIKRALAVVLEDLNDYNNSFIVPIQIKSFLIHTDKSKHLEDINFQSNAPIST